MTLITIIGTEYCKNYLVFQTDECTVYFRSDASCAILNTQYYYSYLTSNNTILFNYFNYDGGRRDVKNISAAALVYQKHNNNNNDNKNIIICARGMSCVHSHSRRRRGGVIVSRGGVGGNEVSRGGGDKGG